MASISQRNGQVFRAISDPGRRKILDRLARDGESPALTLGKGLATSQPALSKQLRVLRTAGLVKVRRNGRRQIYTLNAAPLLVIDGWLDLYRRFWSDRLDGLGAHLESTR